MNVNRRNFLSAATGMAGGAALSLLFKKNSAASVNNKLPNIIFINTDDHAQWAVGAYGNSEIYTPNIDRLAEQGMKFNRAFTCPVCSPSRCMVMTGCYNHQMGIEDWISATEPVGMPLQVPTLAEELKQAGYRTALVGKWHLGHTRSDFYPTSRGFDYFAGNRRGAESGYWDPTIVEGDRTVEHNGGVTDVLADCAIRFMKTYREQPFALFFHTLRPHSPYVPVPEEDWEPYKGKKLSVPHVDGVPEERLRTITEKYYASITSVDRNVGRLMDELERLGIADNTMVIFTGDNGYNIGHHGLLTKGNGYMMATRKTRPNIWDTSAMVPLIIRYPGVVKQGSVCEKMVSTIDYFPTFLDIANIRRRPGLLLEGMNMMLLLKEEETIWRDELFLVYNQHHYIPNARMRMIRTEEWKLVHHYEEGADHELYDLKNDPGETTSLYGQDDVKAVQSELHRRLVLFEKRTGALV